MRLGFRTVVLSLVVIASGVGAQQRPRTEYGIGIEYRRQLGTLADSQDRRKGLAIRIQADVPWTNHFGWRVEGAYAQVQYKRQDPLGLTPINETNLELGGFIRAFPAAAARVRPYLIAGPMASLRASCETDIAFGQSDYQPCRTQDDFLFGWGAGAGVRLANWIGGWSWFLETKYLSKVTAAGGGNLIAISFGAAFE